MPTNRPLFTALGYAWQFGYTIVVPLVLLALLGRFLDAKLGTKPWFLLGGILLAVIVSSIAVVRTALRIFRDVSDGQHHENGTNRHGTPPPKTNALP